MKINIFLLLAAATALTACSDDAGNAEQTSAADGASAVLSRSEVRYDANGDVLSIVTYSDPGPDGVWFTEDDVVER